MSNTFAIENARIVLVIVESKLIYLPLLLDCMFASASLDGAIVLWSSHSISYTRQFNFVKNYEGPNHTYPASAQHVFTVDQVRRKLKCLFSLFFILLGSVYIFVVGTEHNEGCVSLLLTNNKHSFCFIYLD